MTLSPCTCWHWNQPKLILRRVEVSKSSGCCMLHVDNLVGNSFFFCMDQWPWAMSDRIATTGRGSIDKVDARAQCCDGLVGLVRSHSRLNALECYRFVSRLSCSAQNLVNRKEFKLKMASTMFTRNSSTWTRYHSLFSKSGVSLKYRYLPPFRHHQTSPRKQGKYANGRVGRRDIDSPIAHSHRIRIRHFRLLVRPENVQKLNFGKCFKEKYTKKGWRYGEGNRYVSKLSFFL